MPAENSGSDPRPAGADPAFSNAARAWAELVDGWWRTQSAMLPPELERAMTATLDQSKALVDMACAQAARAAGGVAPASPEPAEDFGLWQPVIDASRACEDSLLGSAGGSDASGTDAARAYRRAATAYLNEFAHINTELAKRLQRKIAADPPFDFRGLHAAVVQEAENAYLERVSTERFAALQAEFINAMFRLRRETAGSGAP